MKRLLIILFFIALWLPILQMSFNIFPSPTNTEKRTLKSFPSTTSIGKWANDFDGYFNDRFGFRNWLTMGNSYMMAKIFDISAVPIVVIGKNGWLFYKSEATDDGPSISDYQGLAPLSQDQLVRTKTDLDIIAASLSAQNIKFLVLVAPNKSTIYGQYLPDSIKKVKPITRFDQLKSYLASDQNFTFVDTRELLKNPPLSYPTYYKTDTHWNDYGAFLVAQNLVSDLQLSDFKITPAPNFTQGDITTMLNMEGQFKDSAVNVKPSVEPQVNETVVQYPPDAGGYQVINSGISNGQKLLMFGDSYSGALRIFLSSKFSESIFIGLGPTYKFRTDVIELEKPNIVIWEVAERFIDRLHLKKIRYNYIVMTTDLVIKPQNKWYEIDLRELWQYRELMGVLAWRDVTVRYKQTLLGVSWAVFQPIVTTGIFSIFFGKIAKIPSDGIPYPLFALIGLTLWNFFSAAVSNVSNSLINNGGIISKVYLPKLVIPFASVVTAAIDFGITSTLVLIAMIFFGYFPSVSFLWSFPILFLILVLTILGVGLFMAGINILYRDVRYILPFFIQVGLYVSPIIYPLSVVYDWKKYLLYINPLTAVIEGTRLLISGKNIDPVLTLVGFVVSVVFFIIGVFVFRKIEYRFVDIS